jgi:hypothetical protein
MLGCEVGGGLQRSTLLTTTTIGTFLRGFSQLKV